MHAYIIYAAPQNHLLFANRQFLARINHDGTGVQAIRLTHSSGIAPNAIAIDYDIRLEGS